MIEVEPRPWAAQALCAGRSEDFVFDTKGSTNLPKRRAIAAAVEICHRCPVQTDCRLWAIYTPTALPGAVLGGLTPKEVCAERRRPEHLLARRFLNRPRCGTARAYERHLEFNEACEICRDFNTRRSNPTGNQPGQLSRAS